MRNKVLILLTILFSPCLFVDCVKGQIQPLNFRHLTVDNGLSHTDAKDIKQDRSGFIWIATLYGLDRYDGYSIKQYYNNVDLPNNAFKNRIWSLYPDEDGKIWLATEAGIECFDSKKEKFLTINDSKRNAYKVRHTNIIKLKNNRIFTLSNNKPNLYKINNSKLLKLNIQIPNVKFNNAIENGAGDIWLVSDRSIWLLDLNNKLKKISDIVDEEASRYYISKIYRTNTHLILVDHNKILVFDNLLSTKFSRIKSIKQIEIRSVSSILDVVQDHRGNYWVSTSNGLFLYSNTFKLLKRITAEHVIDGLTTNRTETLFIDRSQCLWIGTFGGGINYLDLNAKLFYKVQHSPGSSNTLSGNHIRAVLEENKSSLWIGTNENGLDHYNPITGQFTHFNNSTNPSLDRQAINALAIDKDGLLWIGTEKGIRVLNKNRTKFINLPNSSKFPNYQIESLSIDYYGNIWFGSIEGNFGSIYKSASGYITKIFGASHSIYADPDQPQIFASTVNGIKHILIDSKGSIQREYRYGSTNEPGSLTSNYVWPIKKHTDSTLWIGTIGGGLNFVKLLPNGKYKAQNYRYTLNAFNDVECIELDTKGNVWIGGRGLGVLNQKTNRITVYDKNDGLQSNSFKVGASCTGEDGRLYFGGINGLNYFFPDSIKVNQILSHSRFTDLSINNKICEIGEVGKPLQTSVAYSKAAHLSYLENNFVISFSAMHFANPIKCQYRYKLVGFDKDWKYTNGNNPSAKYSNLDYNNYRFVLQSSNNDGKWSPTQSSLNISISPPWWKSTALKTFYIIILCLGLIGAYIYQAKILTLKSELRVKELEERKREEIHQHREELYQQQLEFFTNVSHEFRTPLTLILGPLEALVKHSGESAYQRSYELMYRNAKRLVNLINELMNFRKVSESTIHLRVIQFDLADFVDAMHEEFNDLAKKKNILFETKRPTNEAISWVDPQIIEKIIFNLLTNSFKYTDPHGEVTFEVFDDKELFKPQYANEYKITNDFRASSYVYFKITDTGVGISNESIGQIFDRYFRVSKENIGSGIGLSLVKSLTVLHKGDLYVYSEENKGTQIIIAIPNKKDDYLEEELNTNNSTNTSINLEKIDKDVEYNDSAQSVFQPIEPIYEGSYHILIVEDNHELRDFLKNTLSRYYRVSDASNGEIGLQKALESSPDLIISDVMMPVMNGIEFCRHVKGNLEISHIPFVLLSAQDELESKLDGMRSGADYYFSKPLSVDLLIISIKSIFEQRQKLKIRYTQDHYSEAIALVHNDKDKDFLNKLINIIEVNMHDSDLDVDFLCQNLYTSRTKLYQKINAVTGQSIGEFIRTVRLKKAAHIMTHEDVTLNEVINRIGIQSISYFSRAFKKEFGESPSQFIKKLKNTGD
ncbi:MAG TPA: two-component regulator propeller domain-containing protein [Pedobacter sp.]|jgi:signal transduction histidine kinase/ligand-binding sensor domain-containing protein/DNA-binding response OmpR family regulator